MVWFGTLQRYKKESFLDFRNVLIYGHILGNISMDIDIYPRKRIALHSLFALVLGLLCSSVPILQNVGQVRPCP